MQTDSFALSTSAGAVAQKVPWIMGWNLIVWLQVRAVGLAFPKREVLAKAIFYIVEPSPNPTCRYK